MRFEPTQEKRLATPGRLCYLITLEHENGQAREIRVVRRVFDEYSSPEW